MIDPVGHASRQPASSQCLQTSERKTQRNGSSVPVICCPSLTGCSRNMTCRQVEAPRVSVLSYEFPVKLKPSAGTWFHSLQATSQALHPIHNVASVRNALTVITFLRSPPRMASGAPTAVPVSVPPTVPALLCLARGDQQQRCKAAPSFPRCA